MDEFTKKRVRRAIKDNPDLSVKFIITFMRLKLKYDFDDPITYVRRKSAINKDK